MNDIATSELLARISIMWNRQKLNSWDIAKALKIHEQVALRYIWQVKR